MSQVSLAAELERAVRIPERRKKRVVIVAGMDLEAIRAMQVELAKFKEVKARKDARAWARIKADPERLAKHRARTGKWAKKNVAKRRAVRARYRERNRAHIRKAQREWLRKKKARAAQEAA